MAQEAMWLSPTDRFAIVANVHIPARSLQNSTVNRIPILVKLTQQQTRINASGFNPLA